MTDPHSKPADAGPETPQLDAADASAAPSGDSPVASATDATSTLDSAPGASSGPDVAADRTAPVPAAARSRNITLVATIVAFAAGCVVALAAYVALNHGTLRGSTVPQAYGAEKLAVPRGTSRLDGGTLIAQAPADDVLIVATQTDFRARDLSAVAWDAIDVPAGADVRLLFNSDYTPRRAHNRPLVVEDGRVQPIALGGDPNWLGRITGLALVVRAPGATIRVRGVTVKSQSAWQLAGDRAREWFRYEPWNGTSINSVTGGAQAQSLPLPVPLVLAALLAFGALLLVRRFAPDRLPGSPASIAVGVFILAWAVLDVRWSVNLARQNAETLGRYGGKDVIERALAAEDGDLFRFLEKAKAAMPAEPQRVVVLASANYYRGRAGWHLLPHRVEWEPARDSAPAPGVLRAGDYVVVWQRPGAQFDAAAERLRLENGVDLHARLLLDERGAALYAIL